MSQQTAEPKQWHKFIDSPQWQEAVGQNPGLAPSFDNLESFVELPEGVEKLRELFFQLAVEGKLRTHNGSDGTATQLLEVIEEKRTKLVADKVIKKTKPYASIESTDEPHELPGNWSWIRIGQVARAVEYGTSEKAKGRPSDVPVLRMGNIQGGQVILENLKYVHDSIEDLPGLYLQPGDILFNRTNSWELVGKTGVFKGPRDEYTFASYLIRVRTFAEVDPDFVSLAMNAPYYRETQIVPTLTQQCGQANFNGTKMKNSLVPLPPLAEQRRIVSKVEGLMSLCDTLEDQRRARESVRERASRSVLVRLTSASVHRPALADPDQKSERERPTDTNRRSSTARADSKEPTASGLSLTEGSNQPQGASPGSEPPTSATTGASTQRLMNGTETLSSAWQRLSDHFEVLLDQPETLAHLRQSILQLAVQGKLVPQDSSDEPASKLLTKIGERRAELVANKEIKNAKPFPAI